jgi:hypothetical protein
MAKAQGENVHIQAKPKKTTQGNSVRSKTRHNNKKSRGQGK